MLHSKKSNNCNNKLKVVNLKKNDKHFIPRDREELDGAISKWKDKEKDAIQDYGHISHWDTSQIKDMSGLFKDTTFNENINTKQIKMENGKEYKAWDVSIVTDMTSMFHGAESFNQPLNNWDVSNVQNMNSMFQGALKFNQKIDCWDVLSISSSNFDKMFESALDMNNCNKHWRTQDFPECDN